MVVAYIHVIHVNYITVAVCLLQMAMYIYHKVRNHINYVHIGMHNSTVCNHISAYSHVLHVQVML